MRTILLICFVAVFSSLTAQVVYMDEQSGEEVIIEQGMPDEVLKLFLASKEAVAIEFNLYESTQSVWPFKLQLKDKKWQIYSVAQADNLANRIPYDSISFPNGTDYYDHAIIVKNKGKYDLLLLEYAQVLKKFRFEKLKFVARPDSDNYFEWYKILAKKKGYWGQITEEGFEIQPFVYSRPEDVPLYSFDNDLAPGLMQLRKKEKVDLIEPLDEMGYTVKARKIKTGKWGIYSGEGFYFENVPPIYDDISITAEPEVYSVRKSGKVGICTYYELVKPTEFDDFQTIFLDYAHGCALQRNGKWQLYDCFEGHLLVEGTADNLEELLELWLNR